MILLGSTAILPPAHAQPCVVPDNGGGTVDLPPAGCGYVSPADLHRMIDGLPPGTTINISAKHDRFFNVVRGPGGSLGGEVEQFNSFVTMNMEGTGMLAGFNRVIAMQLQAETHVGPRSPGFAVQSFDTDMFGLQGQLPPGDPDFDLLRITGGSGFGMPSPGHTTLTRMSGGGNWNVDSFFDIEYRIDFVGKPGGALSGMSGSTTATIRMGAGGPPRCVVPDDGSGTVQLPPANCGYVSPADLHRMIDGLPPGTTIEVSAEHFEFFNITRMPGGSLGGETETFDSQLRMHLNGTGMLAGYMRDLAMPMTAETHIGPRTPGDPNQPFDTDMFGLQGQLPPGDPDFDLLRITAGTGFGMPSPGHTTLTQLPGGSWNVDSFFDITYRLDFVGAPGGPLAGMSGSTTATIRMQTGNPPPPCPPIPGGTDIFPSSAKLVLQGPDGNMHVVRLDSQGMGTSVVQRGNQLGDTIPIELVQLELRSAFPIPLGPSSPVTPILVRESPSQPSLGMIQNVVQDPNAGCGLASGDSFFDVFFEVEVGDPNDPVADEVWYNPDPIHIRSTIRELPPRSPYENPFVRPVQLLDRATNAPRALVFYELHDPDPNLPPGGTDCFDTMLTNRILVYGPGYSNALMSQGPTQVQRTDPGMLPTGQPFIDTEIVMMDLQGFDPFLGPFMLTVRPTPPGPPSHGQAVGQPPPNPVYPVDSFFDVFVDLRGPSFGNLHSEGPVQIGQKLGSVPPPLGTRLQSPPGVPTRLLDDAGNPVGEISDIDHKLGTYRSWLPPPPGGDDCLDSWLTLKIEVFPTGCSETVMLNGPTRILRGNPSDPGDGNDLIQTLMAKLKLAGTSNCLGSLMVALDANQPSSGALRSLAPAENFPMDSFFDVFAAVDSSLYGPLTVGGSSRMTTTINNVPPDPGEIYYGPGTVIPIFDAAGNLIGQIVEVEHKIHRRIECPCDCLPEITFDASGCLHLDAAGGGAGAHYDVARGNVAQPPDPTTWAASFGAAACLQDDGPATLCDPAAPLPGRALWYLARDGYDTGQANYKDCEVPPVDPDLNLTACPR